MWGYIITAIIVIIICLFIYYPIWLLVPMFDGGEYINSQVDHNSYRIINDFENKQHAADKLAMLNSLNTSFIDYMGNKCDNSYCNKTQRKIIHNLSNRYNSSSLIENNPTSVNNTSYSQLKGKILSMCLREKITGRNEMHDDNLLQFVDLHELSHIASNSYGHNNEFWHTFKQVLHDAAECDNCRYDPVDYSQYPIRYCGLVVTYNPFYK